MSETLIQNELNNLSALKESIAAESCVGNTPFIRLGEGENAPVLDYNLPQSATFTTYGSIKIDPGNAELNILEPLTTVSGGETRGENEENISKLWAESIQLGVNNLAPGINAKAFRKAVNPDKSDFMAVSLMASASNSNGSGDGEDETIQSTPNVVINDTCLNEEQIANLIERKYIPLATKKLNGAGARIRLVKQPDEPTPALYIIEEYKTSSFLGRYGAGKVLQTLSLLPGEKTTITVMTYKNSTSTRTQSENLLDTFSQSSVDEMENLIEEENGTSNDQSGSLSASIGGSILGVDLNASSNYSARRTANSRALNRALGKHVEQSNSARNVEINTSTTETVAEGEEYTTVREIENVNKSRVLNFVFRQLLQEYISITYLSNIRIAYSDGTPASLRIVDIEDIDSLLTLAIDNQNDIETTKQNIIDQYASISNYKGYEVQFLKPKDMDGNTLEPPFVPNENAAYWTCSAEDSHEHINVAGVILQVQTNVLRTDSVIADAVMGQGEALDCFNQRAQDSIAMSQYLKNLEQMQRISLIESIRNMPDGDTKAALLKVLLGEGNDAPQTQVITNNANTSNQ